MVPDDPVTVRRAFSIAGLWRMRGCAFVEIIYRVVGRVTSWMSALRHGDPVNVLGPVGNRLTLDASTKLVLLVAGGVGLPPVLWWAEKLAASTVQTVAFVGAQSRELLPLRLLAGRSPRVDTIAQPLVWEFARLGIEVVLSTDDGSVGRAGYVTDALREYVEAQGLQPDTVAVYCCGPESMMRRVSELCTHWRMACQVCMERTMACGMGTCQSCVVPVRDATTAAGWSYALCCTWGPVFDGRQILWEDRPLACIE